MHVDVLVAGGLEGLVVAAQLQNGLLWHADSPGCPGIASSMFSEASGVTQRSGPPRNVGRSSPPIYIYIYLYIYIGHIFYG